MKRFITAFILLLALASHTNLKAQNISTKSSQQFMQITTV